MSWDKAIGTAVGGLVTIKVLDVAGKMMTKSGRHRKGKHKKKRSSSKSIWTI